MDNHAKPIERVVRAAETTRFYTKDALPVHEVPKASGEGMRAATITDARKNGWRPSVTEVCKILAKGGLEAWKMDHLMDVIIQWSNKGEAIIDPVEWKRDMYSLHREYAQLAAARGTEIHKQIEIAIINDTEPEDVAALEAIRQIRQRYAGWELDVEVCLSSPYGWGGRLDIRARRGSEVIIGDVKTKDIEKFKKPAFDNGLQLGAYAMALNPEAQLDTIIVDRAVGTTLFYRWGEKWKRTQSPNNEMLMKAFNHLFCVWVSQNNYDPREI